MIDTLRSLRWTDYFLYALVDPRSLYRHISQNDPKAFALSFTVPAAAAIADILAGSLFGNQTLFFFYKITYGWILLSIFYVLKNAVISTMMDASAQFRGMKGNAREMVCLVNFSMFPQVFILPLTCIFVVFGFAPVFFYIAIGLGLTVWSALVAVQGISEMHRTNTGKAVFIYILPYIVIWSALLFMTVLLFILTGGYLTS